MNSSFQTVSYEQESLHELNLVKSTTLPVIIGMQVGSYQSRIICTVSPIKHENISLMKRSRLDLIFEADEGGVNRDGDSEMNSGQILATFPARTKSDNFLLLPYRPSQCCQYILQENPIIKKLKNVWCDAISKQKDILKLFITFKMACSSSFS